MRKLRILIVYPDAAGLALLTSMLKSLGHAIEEATNDRAAVRLMERNEIDLVLAGVDPGDHDALELLTYVRRKHREIPVVLLFPRLQPERAKEALRLGAMTVLKYPVPAAELRAAVLQALEHCGPRPAEQPVEEAAGGAEGPAAGAMAGAPAQAILPMGANAAASGHSPRPAAAGAGGGEAVALAPMGPMVAASLQPATSAMVLRVPGAGPFSRVDAVARDLGLLGDDPSWKQVLDLAATLAETRASVLIVGEPGTGKSMVARLLHALGPGDRAPFVALEPDALPDQTASDPSDETPDDDDSAGERDDAAPAPGVSSISWAQNLDRARGGSLFFDEVAALPTEIQLALLRELQVHDRPSAAGHPRLFGGARFIMATSENLAALIDQGRFHQELFHRASTITLTLPPLRHRGSDVELLAETFRARYAQEFRKKVVGFTREALDVLQRHHWPGNVRELEAAVRRCIVMCLGPRITSNHLGPILSHHAQSRGGVPSRPHMAMGIRPLKEALEEPEKRIILQALQALNWNRQETARILNINRTTLYKKMKKYGLLIDEPAWAE